MALHRGTRFTVPERDPHGSTMSDATGMKILSGPARTVVSTSATRHVGSTNMTQASTLLEEVT